MSKLEIRGVPITFPFEPYLLQKDYMEKVIECLQNQTNAVLESPTGTGKTLSLLCSTLAWLQLKKAQLQTQSVRRTANLSEEEDYLSSLQQELDNKAGKLSRNSRAFLGIPTIIYSSRTHSQLSQAMQELKRTAYSYMRATIIGSREQMCINPDVINEEKSNKVALCRAKVSGRCCYYYNRVEKFKTNFLAESSSIIDIEDLVKFGEKDKFCPYYMAKELKQQSDIIFMPYNYLIDPFARKAVELELADSIVILDEAHNIERVCEESASFQIKTTDIALCIEEITEVMLAMTNVPDLFTSRDVPKDFDADDLCNLKQIFLDLEKSIDSIEVKNPSEGTTYPGDYIFEVLNKAGIHDQNYTALVDLITKIVQFLAIAREGPFARKGNGLKLIEDLLNVVFTKTTTEFKDKVKKCYKVHVTIEEPKNKKSGGTWLDKASLGKKTGCRVLNYWCFSPGFGMGMFMDEGVRSVILTSGTLAPLAPLISELELAVQVRLENPHIVKGDQVCVKIVSKGPDMEILNCNFQNRNNCKYLTSVGRTVLNLARIIPDGLLVFFPSYPMLNNFQNHWQEEGIWSSICEQKKIFVEPKDKTAFNNVMKEYYDHIKCPDFKGAMFFGVCRGKVSEGLDFADINGRAVLIIGLPYPPLKDPRVILKKQYLDICNAKNKEYLRGDEWYSLEATRSVNQAIGRVIRHQHDYGAIILLDSRFSNPRVRNQMSKWLREHVKVVNNFGEIMRDLSQFFRNAKANLPAPKPKLELVKNVTPTEWATSPRKSNYDFSTSSVGSSSSSVIIHKRTNIESLSNVSKRNKILMTKNFSDDTPVIDEDENRKYVLMVKKALKPGDFQQFVEALALYKDLEDLNKFILCLDKIFLDKYSLRYIIQGLNPFIKKQHKRDFTLYWEKMKM